MDIKLHSAMKQQGKRCERVAVVWMICLFAGVGAFSAHGEKKDIRNLGN